MTFYPETASGLPWVPRAGDGRLALAMAQQHGISELLASILAGRGVGLDEVPGFLNPTLRDQLPDPFHLLDMEKAVSRLVRAIEKGERIAVFGDYDVDGATSTALLVHFFAALGVELLTYIPDRAKEGYGPTVGAFEYLIGEGAKLIITVDCGTLAFEPIAYAAAQRTDVIVLDHHQGDAKLPEAVAVVNPNRVDETSPHGNLAAVGVTFLTLVALLKRLREAEYFTKHAGNATEPNLLALLDLVALGTVCDVMPLNGLNRAFVAQGLKVMAQRKQLGLATLADVARMDEAPTVYHLGFLLGPRINAGGRVGAAGLGVELLSIQDPDRAREIAATLDLHNQERQAIEAGVLEAAFAQAALQENMPVLLVAAEGWHQGVIGIVAGRLKEKYQRPVAVASIENGKAKASARSVPGADLGAAIHAAQALGLIETGGGHAMAAGFSLPAGELAALHAFLVSRLGGAVTSYQESRVLKFDAPISVAGASLETLAEITSAGPYGIGNPGPRFLLPRARVLHRQVLKEKHIKLLLADDSGTGKLDAIAFNAMGTTLGDWLMSAQTLGFLGELKRNLWQGRESVQFMIDDVARVD